MPGLPVAVAGSGNIGVNGEIPVQIVTTANQEIPVVTGISIGQQCRMDPNRPALILRRAGEDRLWDIAKGSGSTVDAIRKANGLEAEPAPGQMLLIPVG